MALTQGRWAVAFSLLLLTALAAPPQGSTHPLAPPDRSSPCAALKTFLDSGDRLGSYLADEYSPSPTRAKYARAAELCAEVMRGLDLSQVSAATHEKSGRAAALALYETLSRIPLPPWDAIPSTHTTNWTIPNTEIVLACEPDTAQGHKFLFSPETVARADEFYGRMRDVAYMRPIPFPYLHEMSVLGGGWMIPYSWIRALPTWLQLPLAGQALWKWIIFFMIIVLFGVLLRLALWLSRSASTTHPLRRALARVVLPAFLLMGVPAWAYLSLVQLNLRGSVGVFCQVVNTAMLYVAGAWIVWRLAAVIAEAIIASPNISPQSIDAHLIRICTRLLGMLGGAVLLGVGADRLGMHLYGIIAGLGVGGLALALAAQPTIENLIGGMSLFADKPLRVGDLCQCEGVKGIVEAIGIRSTRIRSPDQTLTSIPNAALSKLSIVNLSQRDRMLIETVIGVRYETSAEQLNNLLIKLRELLRDHPLIHNERARVRLVNFGASTLDIQLFAYAMTTDWTQFRAIREDILLRVIDIVRQSGTSFAFPSQTVYYTRDDTLDTVRTAGSEAQVGDWQEKGELPFQSVELI